MMQQSLSLNSQNSRDMDAAKTTSKTSLLNLMVLRAWRERWTDSQWGINIKTVLPRGVSGDVYNLADCLLQQALVGSTANVLVLNLLKHSLCSQLVSHAAVLRRVTTYDFFDRLFCLTTLLEFLDSIMDSVTCRNKQEEIILPNALVHLVKWLMQIFPVLVKRHERKGEFHTDELKLFEQYCSVVKRFAENQFLLSVLYVGRQEDAVTYGEISQHYAVVKSILASSGYTPANVHIEPNMQCLAYIDISHLKLPVPNFYGNDEAENNVEAVTYIVQPLLAVDVLLNPTKETVFFVHEMQMIQRLKNFSNSRLYYEIIRAGLISLSNMLETSHDTMWGAFTFFKIPQIIKSLHALTPSKEEIPPGDHIPEVLEAFEMILDDNLLLDIMDTKCSCNIIEYVLNDWTKHHLVNETQSKNFAAQREKTSSMLQKRDTNNPQAPSIINFIIRAEVPLNGILKTLSTDYNKVQEALLGVLCQVLVGNSFDLILSVATVEGRLRTFISRLIQCNENSKQVSGETGKQQAIRSTLFDVSFLMLTFITQTYGAEIVLSANNYAGTSFFERWVRECMVERNKPKNPNNIIALCDEEMVDELLLTLSKPDAQTKNTLNWEDICMTLPAVLHHVLVAWEHEALTSTDVKSILDNIKRRLFCYSVCATSYLCAYMYSVREHEFLKPLNMIQQFLAPSNNEELSPQDNVKERMALAFLIIRKMQHDVHPSGTFKPRSIALTQSLVSNTPLIEQFREVWKTIADSSYVSVRSAQMLESLLQAGGPVWLARYLIEEILRCKYVRDMSKTMDIVFSTLHLDIVRCTSALLEEVIPLLVQNRQGEDVNEPQLLVLANLCVFCIISCVEMQNAESTYGYMRNSVSYDGSGGGGAVVTESGVTDDAAGTPDGSKKRARSNDVDDYEMRPGSSKARKTVSGDDATSSVDDFSNESQLLAEAAASLDSISSAAGEQCQKNVNNNNNNSNNKTDEPNKGLGTWSLNVTQTESTAATECYDDEEASRNSLAEAIASVSGIVSAVNNEVSNKSLDDACMDAEAGISNMSNNGSGAANAVTLPAAESMDYGADSNSSAANASKEILAEVPSELLMLEDKTDKVASEASETVLKSANVASHNNADDVDGGGGKTIDEGIEKTEDNNGNRAETLGDKTPDNSNENSTGEQVTSDNVPQGCEKDMKNKDGNDDDSVVVSGGGGCVGNGSAVDLNVVVDEIVGDTGKKNNDVVAAGATGNSLENNETGALAANVDGSDVISIASTTITTTTTSTSVALTMISDLAAVDTVLGIDAVDGDSNHKVVVSTKHDSNSSTITTANVVNSETVKGADNAATDVSPNDDSQIYIEAAGNLSLNTDAVGTAENSCDATKSESAVTDAAAMVAIMSAEDGKKTEAMAKKDALSSSCGIEDISEDAVDGILEKVVAEGSVDMSTHASGKEDAKKVEPSCGAVAAAADDSTETSNSTNITPSSHKNNNNNSNADSAVKSTSGTDIADIDMLPTCSSETSHDKTTSSFLDMSEGNSVSAELSAAGLDIESARDSTTSDLVAEVANAAAAGHDLDQMTDVNMDVDTDMNLVGGEGSGDGDTLAQAFAAADAFNLGEEATFSGRLAALAQLEGEEVIGGFGDNDSNTSRTNPTGSEKSAKISNLVTTSIDNNNDNNETVTVSTASRISSSSNSGNSNMGNSLPEDDIPSTSGISSARTNSSNNKNTNNNNNSSNTQHADHASYKHNNTILQVKRLPRYSNDLREPLASSVQALFKAFQQFVTTEELSPKVYFVHQFITLLVERGGERVRPVLNLLPITIMPAMLKILLNNDISCGLITRLYNLDTATGRQTTISDLCLWQNIKLKQESTQM